MMTPNINRVLIYGGSFDPPTVAHVAGVKHAIEMHSNEIDEVWVLPVYTHRFKAMQDPSRASFAHRMEMCKIAFGTITTKPVKVLALEMMNEYGSTHQMMKILKQTYSQNIFSLLIGEDAALEVEGSWKYGTTLINENRFLVLPRGFSKPEQWAWYLSGKHAYLETFPIMDELQYKSPISSTTVRASFGRALNTYVLGSMLEPGVLSYIVENNLYYATEGMQWVPRD